MYHGSWDITKLQEQMVEHTINLAVIDLICQEDSIHVLKTKVNLFLTSRKEQIRKTGNTRFLDKQFIAFTLANSLIALIVNDRQLIQAKRRLLYEQNSIKQKMDDLQRKIIDCEEKSCAVITHLCNFHNF